MGKQTNENGQSQKGKVDKSVVIRNITYFVTGLAILGTIGVAVVAIFWWKEKELGINFIVQTLLPLWGTWFGTILAFYFSKENLDVAMEQNDKLVTKLSERDQQFASKSAYSVMVPFAEIKRLNYEDHEEKFLSEIIDKPGFENFNRFPVFGKDKKLKVIIHRSLIFEYLYKSLKDGKEITLNHFLKIPDVQKDLKNSAAFVAVTATLLDAKNEMDKFRYCEDVFITEDGKKTSEVIGWITDRDIYENGRV